MKKLIGIMGVIGLASVLVLPVFAGSATYNSTVSGSQNWHISLPSAGHFSSTVSRLSGYSSYTNAFVLNDTYSPITQLYFVEVSPNTGLTASAGANTGSGSYIVVHNTYGGGSATTYDTW